MKYLLAIIVILALGVCSTSSAFADTGSGVAVRMETVVVSGDSGSSGSNHGCSGGGGYWASTYSNDGPDDSTPLDTVVTTGNTTVQAEGLDTIENPTYTPPSYNEVMEVTFPEEAQQSTTVAWIILAAILGGVIYVLYKLLKPEKQ